MDESSIVSLNMFGHTITTKANDFSKICFCCTACRCLKGQVSGQIAEERKGHEDGQDKIAQQKYIARVTSLLRTVIA